MIILAVNPLDYRYGTTFRTRLFVDSFKRLGHTIKYVESNYNGSDENVISIQQSDNITGYLYGSIRRFHICFIESYNLLFLQNFTPLTLSCLFAAKLRNKSVMVDWDAFEYLFQKTVFRKILTFLIEFFCPYLVNYITSPSTYLINYVKKRNVSKIIRLPQLIDTNLFDPCRFEKSVLRKKMSWENKIILCYLCAFNPGGVRDLGVILKTVKIVMQKRQDVYLLLIGEGILENKVKELLTRYSINNFYILGIKSQDKVVEYLNTSDICLIYLQSDMGSIMRTSIKLLAYLSMNKVVIGYLVGESKDAFNKYIVSCSQDTDSFVNQILRIIDKRDFNFSSRKYILEHYDSGLIDKYLNEALKNIPCE